MKRRILREWFGAARRLFGLSMIDRAAVTGKTMEEIMACAKEYLPPFLSGKKTFKVEAKRADKTFPLTSPEISAEVGGAILSGLPAVARGCPQSGCDGAGGSARGRGLCSHRRRAGRQRVCRSARTAGDCCSFRAALTPRWPVI